MGYGIQRARMETHLASAHKALWRAHAAAEAMGSEGDEHDIFQLLEEVRRLSEASLRDRLRAAPQTRSEPTQLRLT